ncbi:PAS domain-containing protein [Bradyrhizobium oligotrophicum]|nr:PAS domain-containing protein [Bradyrhizobium oligotrophicum]
MKRFICEQNVAHFEKLLAESTDAVLLRTLRVLLASTRRELALLEAADVGADPSSSNLHRRPVADATAIKRHFQREFDTSPHPYMLIDPGPGLYIADINAAYAAVTFTERQMIAGKSLFEVFPDNPDDPLADGVNNLYGSLRTVVQTGQPHAMPIQRYDIRNAEGVFVERHWQPINTPLHDEQGRLAFILHHVEDVTPDVKAG